jgi:hypothetical protein
MVGKVGKVGNPSVHKAGCFPTSFVPSRKLCRSPSDPSDSELRGRKPGNRWAGTAFRPFRPFRPNKT